jgi:hypothetical protein
MLVSGLNPFAASMASSVPSAEVSAMSTAAQGAQSAAVGSQLKGLMKIIDDNIKSSFSTFA